MTTLGRATREAEVAELIDAVRRAPGRRDELVALLPETDSLYDGRSSAEVTRLRGYLLAAFADTGLPPAALPYVLEVLESGHLPYEVAGAAIAVRGFGGGDGAVVVPYLLRALRNLSGIDSTVSFARYDPRWPYERPTTALTEVLRTLAGLGAQAAAALPELDRLAADSGGYSPAVLAELHAATDAIRSRVGATCCHAPVPEGPLEDTATGVSARGLDVALEDQDGRRVSFDAFFTGKPSVLAFFYTRCDSPYKCSLTITKLAQVQALLGERGLAGALRLAAVTYDPAFDLPKRLRRYGADRGMVFGEDVRCFRATSGFDRLSQRLRLGVNYGAATVNRHRIELYILDAEAGVAASFTRLQWDTDAVVAAAEALRVATADGR